MPGTLLVRHWTLTEMPWIPLVLHGSLIEMNGTLNLTVYGEEWTLSLEWKELRWQELGVALGT